MPSSICCSQHKRKQQILHPRLGPVGVAHVECILRSRSCFFQQYPLLVPSVHCPQRVWGCVCACACVQHWHSTERTNMWICQHSAYVKFIPSTRTHTCMHAHTHSHTTWGPQTDGAQSGHCPSFSPSLSSTSFIFHSIYSLHDAHFTSHVCLFIAWKIWDLP